MSITHGDLLYSLFSESIAVFVSQTCRKYLAISETQLQSPALPHASTLVSKALGKIPILQILPSAFEVAPTFAGINHRMSENTRKFFGVDTIFDLEGGVKIAKKFQACFLILVFFKNSDRVLLA